MKITKRVAKEVHNEKVKSYDEGFEKGKNQAIKIIEMKINMLGKGFASSVLEEIKQLILLNNKYKLINPIMIADIEDIELQKDLKDTEKDKIIEDWITKMQVKWETNDKFRLPDVVYGTWKKSIQLLKEGIENLPNPYPLDIFPELTKTDLEYLNYIFNKSHLTLDRVSASLMRRARENVKEEILKGNSKEVYSTTKNRLDTSADKTKGEK